MKKITKIFLGIGLLLSAATQAQCLDAIEGQWPTATSTATTCDGLTVTTVTTAGYASEFSLVNVTAGETYTFSSSITSDYITISSDDGASAVAFGISPVVWVADIDGPVRFYTHTDASCGGNQNLRTRSYVCGIPPCVPSSVVFNTERDCDNSTFTVTADISSLGSAPSLTISDDQSSPTQSVSAPGLVTFGPYAFGTTVVVSVANDDNTLCTVNSQALVIYACPMANDDCSNAVALSCGDTLTAQTTEGASGGTSTSCVGTIGDDVWYRFTGDGQVFTLTATATNDEGPQVEVYESTDGSCDGFSAGTCYAAAGSGSLTTTLTFNTTDGTTYFVHIGSWINGDPATVFDLSLTCQAPPTAPDNDECSGAYVVTVNPDLSCGSVTSGSILGSTASAVDDTACGGTEDDDVWFSFVATDTRHQISLTNVVGTTVTDMFHSLWEGDCSGLTLVAGSCSDANTSTPTGLVVGNTYYVRVYTYGNTALADTTFDLCVGTLPPPPANEDCTGAEPLTVGTAFADFAIVGTNAFSSSTAGLTFNCQTNRKNDVWYSFTVPASGSFTVETDTNTGTAMTDSVVSVFSGTCGALTEVGCDDDTGNGNFSKVSVTGQNPGDTLYIGVWTYGTGNDGEYQLSVYDPTAATSSFDNANFTYYPNPVDTVLNLNYVKNISSVSVFNLLGQEVMAKASNNLTQVDMSALASGTYLVKVTSDNQVKTIKINKR
ncbi:T9SS type A sorting domain-containing protein [Flavobacterium sp. CYK-55]|uniref:T9SS type A sorting domain-containing protein n=1 Tax=Flavobacterium sp. CYK-55 TaxID=2835529 RepID=UPI001BCEEA2D|nr:T9SS type A sorting domain-containing protein [Flavobacterium sp. CYK-55]MBS7786733.1 T9SS type A sorting domain-containing protein [Flavobacterium sp. CYK-55]